MHHPVFGDLLLEHGKKGPYWLNEACSDGDLTIAIDTVGQAEPSEAQVGFFRRVVGSPEDTFRRASVALARRHEEMHGKPVSSEWQQTFRLASIGVPLDGNALLPWEVTFECLTDNTGFLYTCHYENDQLVHVSLDT